MAKKSQVKPGAPTIKPAAAITSLEHHVREGEALLRRPVPEDAYNAWREKGLRLLERAFGENRPEVKSFEDIRTWSHLMGEGEAFWENERFNHLGRQLTNLRSAIELLTIDATESPAETHAAPDPSHEHLASALSFIGEHDARLGEIIKRDLVELRIAREGQLHKASLLLCGSILEAALLDVLDRRRDISQSYLGKRRFPDDASLSDLIRIASDPKLFPDGSRMLTETAASMASSVVDHRDLIHPSREARGNIRVDKPTADLLCAVLVRVATDLHEAHSAGLIALFESL